MFLVITAPCSASREEFAMKTKKIGIIETRGLQRRVFVLAFMGLLAPALFLSAQQTRQAAVLLAGRPRSGEEASAFEPVICGALETALKYSGLRVIPDPRTTPGAEAAGAAAQVFDLANSLQADYLLSCEYSTRGELLNIELRWFELPEGRESALMTKEVRMGLSLDAVLARAAEQMIAAAQPQIRIPLPAAGAGGALRTEPLEPETAALPAETRSAAIPAETRSAAMPAETRAAASPAAAAGEATPRAAEPVPVPQPLPEDQQPAAQPPQVQEPEQAVTREARPAAAVEEAAAAEKPAATAAPRVPTTQAAAPGRRRALTLYFAGAPFFADGLAAEYFPAGYGLFPSLSISYRWPLGKTYVGLGIYSGLNIFRSEGPLAFSDTALLPFGLELRFGVDSRPVGLYVRLSGGPSLFSIDPNATGRLIKLTYYGQAGIGVTLPLGPAFGFVLDAGYSLFLEEQEEPIRGLAPGAGFYIRP
jgi:hypothetical protein